MATGAPNAPTQPDRLLSGQGLVIDKFIRSADDRFTMLMQNDGNLVLSGPQGQVLWAAGTYGKNATEVIMQDDGNLVIYDINNNPLWSSITYGHPGAIFILHIDGNAVVTGANNDTLWATDTVVPATPVQPTQPDRLLTGQGLMPGASIASTDNNYRLIMQSDANLVLYGPGNEVVWASNTSQVGYPWDVIMQDDGNLVILNTVGGSLWASDTSGGSGAMLVVEDNALVIYDSQNKSIWSVGSPSPLSTFTANSTGSQTSISHMGTMISTPTAFSPSASALSNPRSGPGNSHQLIGIVGGILGGVILILLGAFIYAWLRMRKRDGKAPLASANLNTDMQGASVRESSDENNKAERSVNDIVSGN